MLTRSADRRSSLPRALAVTAVGVLTAGTALVVAVLLVASSWVHNPFTTTTTERPDAVVLAKVQDLHRYDAATGRFTTLVDQQTDTQYLPDWLKGERVVLAAEGDVDASVDFSELTAGAIQLGADGKSATVHLPEPTLGQPRLDQSATYVISRDRGLVDRADDALTNGEPSDEQGLYERADEKLADAAAQSDLRDRARANTEQFLRGVLQSAGVQQVTVVFDAPSPADAV